MQNMANAISSRASEQALHAQAILRLILLACSLVLMTWLFARLAGPSGLDAWWACRTHDALPFEAEHCAFWGMMPPLNIHSAVMAMLTTGGVLQGVEAWWWWHRRDRHREVWWLALGAEPVGERAERSGLAAMPETETETETGEGGEEGELAHDEAEEESPRSPASLDETRRRHPEMRLCWWWADANSGGWQRVGVTRLWCSPRLVGLRLTRPGERSRTLWLWPDSAPPAQLHRLRLWLLWPPLAHDMPRQPPAIEPLMARIATDRRQ